MINRSKRRSIILSLTLVFFVWRDRYRSAIPRYVIERCPSPLPYPPVRWKSRRSKGNIGFRFLYRVVVDSLPGIQIEFSLSRSNDPLTNDFSPPPSCIRKHSHRSRYVSLLLFSNRFSFFFFSSLTSVASIDEIIEEEISPRSYVNAYGGQASRIIIDNEREQHPEERKENN